MKSSSFCKHGQSKPVCERLGMDAGVRHPVFQSLSRMSLERKPSISPGATSVASSPQQLPRQTVQLGEFRVRSGQATQQEAKPFEAELGWRTNLTEVYTVAERVGTGAFGQVHLGVHRHSGEHVAIKTMPKIRAKLTRASTLSKVSRETSLLQRAQRCPGVVRLLDTFEDAQNVHLVTELCGGGDLKQHVQAHGALDEHALAFVALQVLSVLQCCHSMGILYADVKPGNFCLMESGTPNSYHLRAIDFGCSQLIGSARLSKRTGTLAFMAPEIFAQNFAHKADVWSTGVLLYWLFTLRLPFWANDKALNITKVEDMANAVSSAPITFDYGPWLHMSPEGVDFVRGCLTRPEDMRLGVEQALQHPWLRSHVGEEQRAAMFQKAAAPAGIL